MAILWAGGEDIDFLASGVLPTVITTAGHFRTFGRCALSMTTQAVGVSPTGTGFRSTPFPGGAVTSCWVSFYFYGTGSFAANSNKRFFGIIKSGTDSGIYFGAGTTASVATLYKWDGTTLTQLAVEGGSGSLRASVLTKVDIQIVNFGATSTINVYLNGALLITFSGDSSISGVAGLDSITSVYINGVGSSTAEISEVIVADEDTRSFSLQTMALTGAGTTDAWTAGVFSNINGTSYSDTTPANTNTAGQNEQFNVTDMPSGTWNVRAVKIAARAAYGAGGTPTKITLGYNNGGAVGAATPGATKTLSAGYTTYDELDNTDPTNAGAAWTQAEMNALQLNVASAT